MYDKVKALKNILGAAKIYDKELNGQDLLVLAKQGKNVISYNMGFKSYHFKHFTGVDSNLSANTFYVKALENRLVASDFEFEDSFLVEKKMEILGNAMKLPYLAKMIGRYSGPKIRLEADAGAGNVQYVMTFRHDEKKGDNWLYPVGVNKEDVRDVTTKSPIVAILRKKSNDSIYNELTYKSKNINFDNLHIPKDLKAVITTEILQQLNPTIRIEKATKNVIDDIPDTKKEKVRISIKEKLSEMKEKSDKLSSKKEKVSEVSKKNQEMSM